MTGSRFFTRRRFMHGLAALGSLVLTGRGLARATPVAGTPTSDGFPLTLTHAIGETIIPSRPERVVATSDFIDLDYLLSLDLLPVLYGFSNAWESGAMPWQTAATKLPAFDAAGDPDIEAIVAASPDLIVSMPLGMANGYALLSDIAPTIVLDWSTPWRQGLRLVGRALGLEARAEERIAETEALLEKARQELAPISRKRMMVGFQYHDAFYVWGEEGAAPRLFQELGMTFVGGPDPILTEVSLEQLQLLDQAELLLSVASDPAGIAAQEASPLFRTLPAVQHGGYGVLTVIQSRALSDGLCPLSIAWVLPHFIALMQQLAAGDGKQLP